MRVNVGDPMIGISNYNKVGDYRFQTTPYCQGFFFYKLH